MKTIFTLIMLSVITITLSQNGINYKAIIKDSNGNVVANQLVDIRISIDVNGFTFNTVYEEVHNIQTDSNGMVILVIGDGEVNFGNNSDFGWNGFDSFLRVEVDTGSGYVDLGTTQFNTVPFAYYAYNVNGLNNSNLNGEGAWRLIGVYTGIEGYGTLGDGAVDLSVSDSGGEMPTYYYGATGDHSFAAGNRTVAQGNFSVALGRNSLALGTTSTAMGNNTRASGITSTALGVGTIASGSSSTAMGFQTTASAFHSTTMGYGTIAPSFAETVVGGFNNTYTPMSATSWDSNDRLFVIGNGNGNSNRSNAMCVLKNGNIGIGTNSPQAALHVNGVFRIGTETIEDTGNNRLSFNASLLPDTDDAMNLGNTSFRWNAVWSVDGTINTSDRREKKNIKNLNYGLREVLKMEPVSFNWKNKNNPDTKLGLIAQDLQKLVPEVVISHTWEIDEDTGKLTMKDLDRLGVHYSDLIPILIKAIQEQQLIIDEQRTTILKQGEQNTKQSEILEALLIRVENIEKSTNQ